jgi:hypothetical protein
VLTRGVCLLALGIPLLVGCGSGGNPDDLTGLGNSEGITRQIAGDWAGKLHQSGLAPFKIAVDITAGGSGRVAYTGIRCGGDWDLQGTRPTTPPQYLFTEEINEGAGGACKGTGTVTLLPIQNHSPNRPAYTRLNYSFSGGGVTSRGLLHRIHAGAQHPVFKQAGVTPP